jgi:hypothetical protein
VGVTALQSATLCRAYYLGTPLGLATLTLAQVAKDQQQQQSSPPGGPEPRLWDPLLQPMFVDSLCHLLHSHMAASGCAVATGQQHNLPVTAAAAGSLLSRHLRASLDVDALEPRGQSVLWSPSGPSCSDVLAASLSLLGVPFAAELQAVAPLLGQVLRDEQLPGRRYLSVLPHLAKDLPEASPEMLLMIARCCAGDCAEA